MGGSFTLALIILCSQFGSLVSSLFHFFFMIVFGGGLGSERHQHLLEGRGLPKIRIHPPGTSQGPLRSSDDIGAINLLVLLNHVDVVEHLVRLNIHAGD
jgi:hypothetical protein